MDARDQLFELVDREMRQPSLADIGGFRPESGLKSWFGGGFQMPREEPWPLFQGKPMTPLLQVVTSELPHVPDPIAACRVAQVFVADEFPVDTPTFSSPHFEIRTYAEEVLEPRESPLEYSTPRPFQIRWSLGEPEGPCWEDASLFASYELITKFVEIDDCFKLYYDRYSPNPNTKVGGWPSYIQGAPAVEGDFVIQVASEGKPRWMVGDCGSLYFFKRDNQWGMHFDCY